MILDRRWEKHVTGSEKPCSDMENLRGLLYETAALLEKVNGCEDVEQKTSLDAIAQHLLTLYDISLNENISKTEIKDALLSAAFAIQPSKESLEAFAPEIYEELIEIERKTSEQLGVYGSKVAVKTEKQGFQRR